MNYMNKTKAHVISQKCILRSRAQSKTLKLVICSFYLFFHKEYKKKRNVHDKIKLALILFFRLGKAFDWITPEKNKGVSVFLPSTEGRWSPVSSVHAERETSHWLEELPRTCSVKGDSLG